MATFTALYDACVLYPAPLRDVLLELALSDLFRAKWSARIHDEWIEAVLADRPDLTRERLQRTRQLMDTQVRDCLVEGFDALIPSLKLPDPDDRHVLAAAICGRADVIVTYNLKDFPETELSQYGVTAQHPDEFLTHLLDLSSDAVRDALHTVRSRLRNPPKSVSEYLQILERQRLTEFVARLRDYTTLF